MISSGPADHRAPQAAAEAVCGPHVVVVDDNRLYREALADPLARRLASYSMETADSVDALRCHCSKAPEVVVLNLASHNSHRLLVEIRALHPEAQLVVTGIDERDEPQVIECAEAGVSGYITRSQSICDLADVIEQLMTGRVVVPPPIAALLLRRVRDIGEKRRNGRLDVLTEREIQILRFIGDGCSNKDIAEALSIEIHTVKNHVHSLLTKLGVRRRGEAAAALAASRQTDQRIKIHA